MVDMKTKYLGLDLPHPFVCGASPLGDTTGSARRAEDGGAAALVIRSLFEEQITQEAMATFTATETHTNTFAEASNFMPDPGDFKIGPEEYLDTIRRVKKAIGIPVIASLNGTSLGGWLSYGRAIQDAGADALELNVFDVVMNEKVAGIDIETETIDMVRELRSSIRLPIAVKLSPFYTSLPHMAAQLEEAGADALVLFNRFFEPDVDVEKLEVTAELQLSDSRELLLRLRWLSILSGLLHKTQFAVSGGVHTAIDAIKAVMCGASAVQVVSALLRNGPQRMKFLHEEMQSWLEEHEYESLESMRGCMNLVRAPDAKVFSRANYARVLQTWVQE